MTDDHIQPATAPIAPSTPTGGDERSPRATGGDDATPDAGGGSPARAAAPRRRRGSRGGQRRRGGGAGGAGDATTGGGPNGDGAPSPSGPAPASVPRRGTVGPDQPELPDRIHEGRATGEAAERALVRKPQIGDTRPAPPVAAGATTPAKATKRGRQPKQGAKDGATGPASDAATATAGGAKKSRRGGRGRTRTSDAPAQAVPSATEIELLERRRGKERKGRPVGRFLMCVQVRPGLSQVAVLEGRNLIEHYVSRPADDISQIHGNIYLGKVQNVLPGMEAAFVDIATPKNAVLYRGDVQYDSEDIVERSAEPRIEQILKARQLILCQVTKNPIGAKGARLTQEVSLPGRFVVLIPNSKTYGISKRLPDDVRKRLRTILDRVKPAEHGLIVRTAAEHATEAELRADMTLLLNQWEQIAAKAARASGPTLLYREPELAVRVIREEFNADYRGVIIDDLRLYEEVRDYVAAFNPELADRIEHFDPATEGLPLFEQFHIHEQLHKALDRKVWLPSGGSLIIEHTEALTVIDVNTGKNVGKSNLEETVFHNNMEAAAEIAKQLRLRDIGGIIVIDFIDMEIRENRAKVVESFRSALARDKTRSQVFDISELGLVEMTRKRIGEGLLTEFSDICPNCEGRGVIVDHSLID
jgi:ribonuclease E